MFFLVAKCGMAVQAKPNGSLASVSPSGPAALSDCFTTACKSWGGGTHLTTPPEPPRRNDDKGTKQRVRFENLATSAAHKVNSHNTNFHTR